MNKQSVRQKLRQQRKNITASEQAHASHSAAQLFSQTPWLIDNNNFAIYFANDGELNLLFITQLIWRLSKNCYLPVVDDKQLHFSLYTRDTQLVTNQYHIPEPNPQSPIIAIEQLDVIFMPLVAFTTSGQRLGMGAGFYDRTLATLNKENRPKLVGVAHDCQCVESIPVDHWDIDLDAVLTPTQLYSFENNDN